MKDEMKTLSRSVTRPVVRASKLTAMSRGLVLLAGLAMCLATSCKDNSSSNSNGDSEEKTLIAVAVDPVPTVEQSEDDIALHPIFDNPLGGTIAIGKGTEPELSEDWDGDGIPNDEEVISNPYVADYPRIVTRISTPITMEIRISETSEEENYTETITDSDVKETLSNSMEDKHYTMAQEKTTPYVTKESLSESGKHAESFGYQDSRSNKSGVNGSFSAGSEKTFKLSTSFGVNVENAKSNSQNSSLEDSFSQSTMAEKTVFEDVDYTDNLDRNGIEFRSDTVETMSKNYRKSEKLKQIEKIGPNAGVVRAGLYLKNPTIDMPVRIRNVKCTLSFRTPGGQFLPVKTFMLKNDDYSEFVADVYGGEEKGPYTIEIDGLNTREIRVALANAYVPQIHVVSFDMEQVPDSNYDPGVDNLKIVEETSKGRTATIKIIGSGLREIYRVAAFDVMDPADPSSAITPGVSLKKALFNILHDRIGYGEGWEMDAEGQLLTVTDDNLKWKGDSPSKDDYVYSDSNVRGNRWNRFETYVKTYIDRFNQPRRIETIRRIDMLSKYNPFSAEDNENYNPNEVLSVDELRKMKFWVVLHNGRYFEGDLNDPIWAGERYEIVLMDMQDFNEHFESFTYTPFQSGGRVYLDTRWNNLTEEQGPFARSVYMGKVLPNDVVELEVDLLESRFLFNEQSSALGFGRPEQTDDRSYYYNFNYHFQKEEPLGEGLPGEFKHEVEGGTESIRVTIGHSANAHRYSIAFYEQGKPQATQTVEVSQQEVQDRGGMVFINSKYPGVTVSGDKNGLPYVVEVHAYGELHGTQVSVDSSSGKQVAYVTSAETQPGPFEFGAGGDVNQINVRLAPAEDAEYYMLRYTGPLNYEGDSETIEVIAYPGYNRLEPTRPAFETLEARDFETGVYSVEAFAFNAKAPAEGTAASGNGHTFVEVDFDRYHNQRRFAPRVSDELFDLNAVDLEVNFNDGSGWFRLQNVDPTKPGGAKGEDRTRVIDCYYSSYMEQNKQKFTIKFMPPHGQYDGLPNVFFGDRSETEMYIRTIQKPEYRDSFWMAPSLDGSGLPVTYMSYTDAPRHLSHAASQEIADMTEKWLTLGTDATGIETAIANLNHAGTVSSVSVDDYFFSPKEERLYSLRASVSNEVQIVEGYRPNRPSFITTPPFAPEDLPGATSTYYSDPYINVSDIASDYSEGYEIYYVEGSVDTAAIYSDAKADADGTSWTQSVEWIDMVPVAPQDNAQKFEDLKPEGTYTFCVAARNRYGLSVPNCATVTIPTRPKVDALPVGKVTVGSVDVRSDGFLISGIQAENAVAYRLYYKDDSLGSDDVDENPPWRALDITGTSIQVNLEPSEWTLFRVRILGFNADGKRGDEEKTVYEALIEPPVTRVDLDDAENIDDFTGLSGSFKPTAHHLVNKAGLPLKEGEGKDFEWDQPITHLLDTKTTGEFNRGAAMRLVDGGRNVVSDLMLTPVAKNLESVVQPPADTVYIDPVRGRFVMPGKPIFWTKMESYNNLLAPDIQYMNNTPAYTVVSNRSGGAGPAPSLAGLGSGYQAGVSGEHRYYHYNYFPLGNNYVDLPQGTVSFWFKGNEPYGGRLWHVAFYVGDTYVKYDTAPRTLTIYKTGDIVQDSLSVNLADNQFHHLRFSWNADAAIPDESSITVYLDGKKVLESSIPIESGQPFKFSSQVYENASEYYLYCLVDNLKIWDSVLEGNPAFEWNGGAGVEDAIHPMYKAQNGFRPNLVADPDDPTNSGGVGYYIPEF